MSGKMKKDSAILLKIIVVLCLLLLADIVIDRIYRKMNYGWESISMDSSRVVQWDEDYYFYQDIEAGKGIFRLRGDAGTLIYECNSASMRIDQGFLYAIVWKENPASGEYVRRFIKYDLERESVEQDILDTAEISEMTSDDTDLTDADGMNGTDRSLMEMKLRKWETKIALDGKGSLLVYNQLSRKLYWMDIDGKKTEAFSGRIKLVEEDEGMHCACLCGNRLFLFHYDKEPGDRLERYVDLNAPGTREAAWKSK